MTTPTYYQGQIKKITNWGDLEHVNVRFTSGDASTHHITINLDSIVAIRELLDHIEKSIRAVNELKHLTIPSIKGLTKTIDDVGSFVDPEDKIGDIVKENLSQKYIACLNPGWRFAKSGDPNQDVHVGSYASVGGVQDALNRAERCDCKLCSSVANQ